MEALFLFAIILFFLHHWVEKRRKLKYLQDNFPTRKEYMQTHGYSSKTLACHSCDGRRISNWGAGTRDDVHRLHICNDCETVLYRSERSLPAQRHKSFRLS